MSPIRCGPRATKFPVEENISTQGFRHARRVLSSGEKPVGLDVADLRRAKPRVPRVDAGAVAWILRASWMV